MNLRGEFQPTILLVATTAPAFVFTGSLDTFTTGAAITIRLLLEDGSVLLIEDGSVLLLEN